MAYLTSLVKHSVSETYRDVEQTELNVRGTMSQLANDVISAQIRQNVSTALTSLSRYVWASSRHIRIYHECEGRIEKSAPRITIWQHEACLVMTNGDHEGRIFLSYSHPNNGFFFLLTIRYHILSLRKGSQKFLNMPRCDML